ncbi:MAG: hypothetical protein LC804_21120 [Acidobacteria bacterium]|nr:hypothetical protein [Acidobacteriota bacterium]
MIVVLMFATVELAGQAARPRIERFFEASSADDRTAKAALEQIAAGWKDSYAAMFVDMARLMRPPRRSALETAERPLTVEDERRASSPRAFLRHPSGPRESRVTDPAATADVSPEADGSRVWRRPERLA